MANDEHVALLKQGVAAWNEWRLKNPNTVPDLSGADLGGADLGGANLIGATSAQQTSAGEPHRGVPVRLDETVMKTNEAWAAKLRARLIGDFQHWKDHDAYKRSFERVVRDLTIKL